jgi:hypothetical protein
MVPMMAQVISGTEKSLHPTISSLLFPILVHGLSSETLSMDAKAACLSSMLPILPMLPGSFPNALWMSLTGALIRILSDPSCAVETRKIAYGVIAQTKDMAPISTLKPFLPQMTRCVLKGLTEPIFLSLCLKDLFGWILANTSKVDVILGELLIVLHHYATPSPLTRDDQVALLDACSQVWKKNSGNMTTEIVQAWKETLTRFDTQTQQSCHAEIVSLIDRIIK